MVADIYASNVIVPAAQVALAGIFVVAATGKAMRSHEFRRVLRVSRVPDNAVPAVARLVPSAELGVAIALVLSEGATLAAAFLAAIAFLIAFGVWMLSVIARGITVSCACFGGASESVSWRGVLRNAVFAGIAGVGAALTFTGAPSLPTSAPLAISVVVAGLLVTALATAMHAVSGELVIRFSQVMDVSTESEEGA